MSNLTIDRILAQIGTATPQTIAEPLPPVKKIVPLTLEELRAILEKHFHLQAVEPQPSAPLEIYFESIYDFAAWYSANKNSFSEQQRAALNTVEEVRAMIEAGCACKRSSREAKAHEYFEKFWVNNKETDLLQTIAYATGAVKVAVNHYCTYTR